MLRMPVFTKGTDTHPEGEPSRYGINVDEEINKIIVIGNIAIRDEILRLLTSAPAVLEAVLGGIRDAGWSVAVHNDYRQNGEARTFWLFTHSSGKWRKGEGRTDNEAIAAMLADLAGGELITATDDECCGQHRWNTAPDTPADQRPYCETCPRRIEEGDAARQAILTERKIGNEADAERDQAYRERNHLVAALARLFPSGIRPTDIPGWDPAWNNCVYIDLPTGQISYHYHDDEAELFKDLPRYTKPFDGHAKDDVHKRLAELGVSYVTERTLREAEAIKERTARCARIAKSKYADRRWHPFYHIAAAGIAEDIEALT